MKAIEIAQIGSFDGLHLVERPDPKPGEHDVLVRIRATSLNYRDLMIPLGTFPRGGSHIGLIPLSDGAGEVVEVGRRVTRVRTGSRVSMPPLVGWIGGPIRAEYTFRNIGFDMDGTLAEYVVFHEDAVVEIPAYMRFDEAAALPCAGTSAWATLTGGNRPVAPGDTVLVQGTGGVSMLALQFAKLFGARVIAITSTDAKAAFLRDVGADEVINYVQHPNWEEQVLALTNGTGVDRVIEIGGAATIQHSAKATRIGGTLSCVGFVGGRTGGADPLLLIGRGLNLNCYLMGNRNDFEAMLAAMALHKVHPVLDQKRFTIAAAAQAFAHLHNANHVGKIIVEVD